MHATAAALPPPIPARHAPNRRATPPAIRRPGRQPTTANALHQLERAGRLPCDLAPLGIALHHVVEPLVARSIVPAVELHKATTILTRQVQQALDRSDPLAAVQLLVTDPDRVATVDGRTARTLCGDSWNSVALHAHARAREAQVGAARFGTRAVLQLAAVHGSSATWPWWRTAAWDELVERWCRGARFAPSVRTALLRTPEWVDDDVLHEVIFGR